MVGGPGGVEDLKWIICLYINKLKQKTNALFSKSTTKVQVKHHKSITQAP
jgi:hypothetical protein